MTFLTITISNRYLNDNEYYHNSGTKIWIQLRSTCISLCGRETKYTHTSLLEPCNRKTSSSLSRLISPVASSPVFFTQLWRDNVKCTCTCQ